MCHAGTGGNTNSHRRPHAHSAGWAAELAPAVLGDGDFLAEVAQQVSEGFPGVGGAHFHALGGFVAISHEDGAAGVLAVAKTGEADAVGIVEIDVLLAVSVVFPGVKQVFKAADLGELDLVFLAVAAVVGVFRAVEIRVENAGIALGAEENQRVGQRLEPSGDGRFQ